MAIPRRAFGLVFWLVILLLIPISVGAAPGEITDIQKETIAAIREITLQLILIAVGVPALLAGFSSTRDAIFSWRPLLWAGIFFLAVSVAFGLMAYGNLIYSLGSGVFDPFAQPVRIRAAGQWICFGIGGIAVLGFIAKNVGMKR